MISKKGREYVLHNLTPYSELCYPLTQHDHHFRGIITWHGDTKHTQLHSEVYLQLLLIVVYVSWWQVEMEHFAEKTEEILKENDRLHKRIEQIQAVGPVGMTEW